MKTVAYWKQLGGAAILIMVTGYWLMTAFTFPVPAWLAVLGSTFGVLIFVDWLLGRGQTDARIEWMRPAALAVLTVAAYGLLTRFDFLPSSALLLAVLVSTILMDVVVRGLLARSPEPQVAVQAPHPAT